jgi:putative peptidoglycan lipid II flippase
LFFSLGLSVFALMKIIVPAFYALHDTRTPVLVALGSMVLNIALNYALYGPLGNGGPPASTSIAAAFSSVMLIGIFRQRHGSLGGTAIAKSIVRCAAASLAMGIVAYLAIQIPGFYAGALLQRIAALALSILASMTVYFGAAYLLRAPELEEMGSIFARRKRP